MDLEDKVKEYFQGLWPGMETAEQCNTSMSFTPLAIMRMVEHFYNLGKFDAKNIQEVQKYWYLEGVNDKEHGNPMQFVPDQEDQVYNPVHLSVDELEAIRKQDYENGKKDILEELDKDAIHCNVFWYDRPLMDYTQEQQDDALEKIDAHVGDKIKLIILKDDDNDKTGSN